MSDKQEADTSIVGPAVETAVSLIHGAALPDPVKRNALKAFNQLCAAVVDIPVAYLEGFAQAKRAENAARADLIRQSGEKIKAGIEVDPAYARAAASRYAQKILRERRSLDEVSSIAASRLEHLDHPDSTTSSEEISEDWINSFEQEAAQKSSTEMQEMFGSILAGEINTPGSFSIRAVKILGQMDKRAAILFQRLCSVAISLRVNSHFFDARVASLGGNAGSNALAKYTLSFDNLNTLQEYGLIISDLNSWMDYAPAIAHNGSVPLGFTYAGQMHALVPKDEGKAPSEFKIHGVMLTKAGRELMTVVPVVEDAEYSKDLRSFFDKSGFTVALVQAAAT